MNLDDILVRDAHAPCAPPPHAWLDAYIEFSRHMSPEGYEHFHEACGIWILSATVSVCRSTIEIG